MMSLDDEVLGPILDRVSRGVITVRIDEYGWPWYLDDGRHCPLNINERRCATTALPWWIPLWRVPIAPVITVVVGSAHAGDRACSSNWSKRPQGQCYVDGLWAMQCGVVIR